MSSCFRVGLFATVLDAASVPAMTANSLSRSGQQRSNAFSSFSADRGLASTLLLILSIILKTSVRSLTTYWNWVSGPSKSDAFRSNKNGETAEEKGRTVPFSMLRDKAPASKLIQGLATFSFVTQIMPNRDFSNSSAISALQRAPLSISSDETKASID